MEFSFTPNAVERSKRFVRFSIRPTETRSEITVSKNGFYYIGKNAANIEKLVSVFKRGYASEGIANAKSELQHSLRQEKNAIPEVIFCESNFDLKSIREFCNFLINNPVLSSIPFVLDATNLSEGELVQIRKSKMVDEIIFMQSTEEKNLLEKVEFLKKVKSKSAAIEMLLYSEKKLAPSWTLPLLFKRAFDIVVSSIALIILSPVFLLIALAVKLESKGPIFYIAKRAGKGYKIFNFYKFRTMRIGADQMIQSISHLNLYDNKNPDGPVFFKIDNDPRITKVGSFLRNTSLDELPQLVNVFLGDMSLVGNRPLPLYEAATLTTDECAKRFLAPAGITGLWQIKKRGKKDMSIEERINLDIDYANKYNFMYDLWIMANTPSALIQKTSV
jgi:lipopolysaccharide/colanic/teichoic acid biosynthesis glycosyltransferase